MKKKLFFLILIVLSHSLKAQPSKDPKNPCFQKMTQLDSVMRISEFETALPLFEQLRKECPKQDARIYTFGVDLIQYRIGRAKEASQKEKEIADLQKLYDEYGRNFPQASGVIPILKAMGLHKNNSNSDQEVFTLLDKAFAASPSAFTNPAALLLYFQLYLEKYKKGDKTISLSNVFAKQEAIDKEIAKQAVLLGPEQGKPFSMVEKSIGRLVDAASTCEDVIQYYGSVFESRKNDTLWMSAATVRLMDKSCVNDPIFAKISTRSQQLKPTSQSAYNLGIIAWRENKTDEAAKYFEQSAQLATDPSEKAATYFTLGSTIFMGKDKIKVKEYLLKSVKEQPSFGKSYLLLSSLYADAGSDCGNSPFEKKALNWLASETALKAGNANANLKGAAEKLARKYAAAAPTKDEIKEAKMAGLTIHFECWINESVVVPKT